MKKFLALIIVGIASWGMMASAELIKHPVLFYTGLIIAGILGLGLVVWATKHFARFIGWSMSSCVYLILALATLGTLGFYKLIPAGVGIVSTMVLSVLLSVMIIRRVGSKAQTSLFWGSVFAFITGYKIRSLINISKDKVNIVSVEKATNDDVDRENVKQALRSLGFSKQEANEATDYAMENKPDGSLAEKVQCALTYINSNNVLNNTND